MRERESVCVRERERERERVVGGKWEGTNIEECCLWVSNGSRLLSLKHK